MDKMIKHWGEDATREVRRAQRQRDEELAARLKAEDGEQQMRHLFDGLLADVEESDAKKAARHREKMLAMFAR